MAWVGRDLKDREAPPPLPGRATNLPIYLTRLPRAPSHLALNTSRDGASTTSLGNHTVYGRHSDVKQSNEDWR